MLRLRIPAQLHNIPLPNAQADFNAECVKTQLEAHCEHENDMERREIQRGSRPGAHWHRCFSLGDPDATHLSILWRDVPSATQIIECRTRHDITTASDIETSAQHALYKLYACIEESC